MRHRQLTCALAAAFASAPSLAFAQDMPDVGALVGVVRWGGVLVSIVLVAVASIALRIVAGLSERLGQRFANRRLQIQKVESFLRFLLYVAAAAVCVGLSFRLDPTALAVIGGTLAVAVGFAMRDLVAAFIAGATIIFDRPFQVGDRVAYAGQYGDIIKIGLRSVQMSTLDHNIVTIPNNKVLTDVTACANYGALEMQMVMTFHIGVDQDVRRAVELVRESCLSSPFAHLTGEVPVLVRQTVVGGTFAIELKAHPYVLDTRYEKPFESDVSLRVIDAFRDHHIGPPAVLVRSPPEAGFASLGASAARDLTALS